MVMFPFVRKVQCTVPDSCCGCGRRAGTFRGLTSLSELNLTDNRIGVLPPRIGDLPKLTVLTLRDNRIKVPPDVLLTAC